MKIAFKIKNRINRSIKARELRVIGPEGKQLGIISLNEALEIAESHDLDLVEISENSNPPVAKIIDFSKYKYEKSKKEKEKKKNQKIIVVKEIKLKPQIDKNDFNIKMKKISTFLSEGKKIKVMLFLRGRNRLYADRGIEMMNGIANMFEEEAIVEKNYSSGITLMLTPKKSQK